MQAGMAWRLAALVALTAGPGAVWGIDFPPVSEAEKSLKTFASAPNAPAAVLFHKGEFQMLDLTRQEVSSRLVVEERIKILTDEGKSQGEVEIPHSEYVRLSGFQGRTILPDGSVVPLPADAKFIRKASKRRNLYVTSVAFPAVAAGAILDYHYELRFDSVYFIEPWYFASRLPTLHAEITYLIPKAMTAQTWNRDPYGVGVRTERGDTVRGAKVRMWADNLAPVTQEIYGLPFEDLAAQVMMVPTGFAEQRLLASWTTTSDLLLDDYDKVLYADGGAAGKARELAKAAGNGQREQALALFRFVRDNIVTEGEGHAFLDPQHTVKRTFDQGKGDVLDKTLLLVAMLKAVKIKANPVWAARRDHGMVDVKVANPAWFDEDVVAAEIDGKRVYLYPCDRTAAFGHLPSYLAGTIGVIPDRKKPEGVGLPDEPFDQNTRRATLQLTIDDKGRTQGSGSLVLAGLHAAEEIDRDRTAEKRTSHWKEWLAGRFKSFTVADIKADEAADDLKVTVTWTMAERADESLGDQVSLVPSQPLGPARQPFTGKTSQRRSPILFDFADSDEVVLTVAWPAGWAVGHQPPPVEQQNDTGALTTEVTVQEAERTLTYRRRFDLKQRQIITIQGVDRVRALYDAVEKSDAESLVLVHR